MSPIHLKSKSPKRKRLEEVIRQTDKENKNKRRGAIVKKNVEKRNNLESFVSPSKTKPLAGNIYIFRVELI